MLLRRRYRRRKENGGAYGTILSVIVIPRGGWPRSITKKSRDDESGEEKSGKP